MRSSRGQATLEYVGAVLLVAVVLFATGIAVAAPGVPGAVVAKLREGLCIVGGDVCTQADAQRLGLEPCPVSTEEHARDNGVSVLLIHAGGSDFWSVERLSDGGVVLTDGYGQDFDAGPSAGLDFGGAEAGGSAGAGLGFRTGHSWVLSEARLKQLLKATKGDPTHAHLLLPGLLGPPSASFLEGGGHSSAELAVSVLKRLPGAGGEARAMLGRRKDRHGTTYYADLGSGSTGLLTDAIPGTDTSGHLALEYRTGAPPAITLRTTVHQGKDSETETIMRLTLDDAEDRAAAERVAFVALRQPALAVRDLVARIKARGTIERMRYETEDDEHGWDYDLGLGVDLGVDHATHARRRRLVSAELLNGPVPGHREDCVGGD